MTTKINIYFHTEIIQFDRDIDYHQMFDNSVHFLWYANKLTVGGNMYDWLGTNWKKVHRLGFTMISTA